MTKAARLAAGIMARPPFIAFQSTSLNWSSGTRSSAVKSKAADFFASSPEPVFISSRLTDSGRCLKGVVSGDAVKERHRGVAAASYWLIGGSPRISSIVRRSEEVEYMV